MAQIVEVDFDVQAVKGAWYRSLGQAPRAPGLHVSSIIRDIDNKLINAGQRPLDAEMTPEESKRAGVYREVGFIWEIMFETFVERMRMRLDGLRQSEVELDGITGTPDIIAVKPWRVIDTKATYKSSRRLVNVQEDFRTWFIQLKAYCRMARTAYATLYILFVNGNYAESGPQIKQLDIIFSAKELADNWYMLTEHAKEMA